MCLNIPPRAFYVTLLSGKKYGKYIYWNIYKLQKTHPRFLIAHLLIFIDYILKNEISFFFSFWLNNVGRQIIRRKSENIECIKTESTFINLEYVCKYICMYWYIYVYIPYKHLYYKFTYTFIYAYMHEYIHMYVYALHIHIL